MSYRICQVIQRNIFEGMGSPIRAWEISRHLRMKGYHVFACSMSEEEGVINSEGVRVYQTRKVVTRPFEVSYARNIPRLSRMILRSCQSERPDIVHAHMFGAALASLFVKKPLVYDMHGLFPDEHIYSESFLKQLRWSLFKVPEFIIRSKAGFLVATSESLREILVDRGVPEQSVEAIPVGVNTGFFSPGRKDNFIRERYGLEGRDIVIYAGSIESYQGIEMLFRSMPHVISKNPNAAFLIVGGGAEYGKYQKLARKPSLKNHVVMTGQVDYGNMPEYIRSGDVGVSLRRLSLMGHVSFPTKLTTYMSCGIPCIATANGDQKKIIQRHKTGFLFRSGDSKGLGERILEALSDKKRLEAMGKKSREISVKEYSWDVLCEKYLSIYERLLE